MGVGVGVGQQWGPLASVNKLLTSTAIKTKLTVSCIGDEVTRFNAVLGINRYACMYVHMLLQKNHKKGASVEQLDIAQEQVVTGRFGLKGLHQQ